MPGCAGSLSVYSVTATPYVSLGRIVDSLLLGPSHHSIGLQAADLIVGCTLASQRAPGDASRWHKQLLPRFARHPDTGLVEGVGLVTYPRRQRGKNRRRQSCSQTDAASRCCFCSLCFDTHSRSSWFCALEVQQLWPCSPRSSLTTRKAIDTTSPPCWLPLHRAMQFENVSRRLYRRRRARSRT